MSVRFKLIMLTLSCLDTFIYYDYIYYDHIFCDNYICCG